METENRENPNPLMAAFRAEVLEVVEKYVTDEVDVDAAVDRAIDNRDLPDEDDLKEATKTAEEALGKAEDTEHVVSKLDDRVERLEAQIEEYEEALETFRRAEPLISAVAAAMDRVIEARVKEAAERLAKVEPAPAELDVEKARMRAALGVVVLDGRIRAFLTENDPKALAQAEEAFGDAAKVKEARAQLDQLAVEGAERTAWSQSA